MGWFQILLIALMGYGAIAYLFDLAGGEKPKVVKSSTKIITILIQVGFIFLAIYFW